MSSSFSTVSVGKALPEMTSIPPPKWADRVRALELALELAQEGALRDLGALGLADQRAERRQNIEYSHRTYGSLGQCSIKVRGRMRFLGSAAGPSGGKNNEESHRPVRESRKQCIIDGRPCAIPRCERDLAAASSVSVWSSRK
eukprot:SAG11_NODE_7271_length_1168_cov_0.962582_2_plen_143_part_00